MDIQQRLVTFIKRANWILFVLACIAGYALASPAFFKGVLLGGLIVTLNFHLMARTLRKAFAPPHLASVNSMLFKYYVRFTISGILIFLLIYKHIVDPLGLIVGLSIVMLSIMLATLHAVGKLIFKEAI